MAPNVTAFLSTGRCATQWLTSVLRELHPEVDAEHEPLGAMYKPRRYFRCYERPEASLAEPAVAEHLARLEQKTRPYVETGWPLFAALPLLAARLPDRLRIVHLTRHPVPTALSHLAHNSYAGSARDDPYTRYATLGPGDANVFAPEYGERWTWLSPYEKCLYWWTEVHRFGLEFAQVAPQIPLLRIRYEDLLSGRREPLQRMLDFMDLAWEDCWLQRVGVRVDRWHHHTDRDLDPLQVRRHPITVSVAAELGYDLEQLDVDRLRARYQGSPDPGLDLARGATV